MLRPARENECEILTELCLRSKAVHGYDADFMAACVDELAVTPKKLIQGGHVVADQAGKAIGFAQVLEDDDGWWLDALFVSPELIGHGVGKVLLEAVTDLARQGGAQGVLIDSDPGAEEFYLSRGAVRVGLSPSGSIPGRFLPQMRLAL